MARPDHHAAAGARAPASLQHLRLIFGIAATALRFGDRPGAVFAAGVVLIPGGLALMSRRTDGRDQRPGNSAAMRRSSASRAYGLSIAGQATHRSERSGGGACDHYVGCRDAPDRDGAIRRACLAECPGVFADEESLMAFESLACPDAVEFVEGSGGHPPGTRGPTASAAAVAE